MVAPQVFKVLTEFKFEIGSAVLASQKLTSEVDRISGAADNALASFQSLGVGLVANLGLGGGGLLGFATKAIQSAEKFRDAQLGFSTVIGANLERFVGSVGTFNDRLLVSQNIIQDIVSDAKRFGIPESELLNLTKLLGAQLSAKGLSGRNFEVPRELSRNLLKAAPVLGIDPTLVEGQLLRTIEGGASLGDTLFRRLTGETQAFKQFGGSAGTKAFNALDAAKRLDILRIGLGQFTQDTQILDDRLNSLNGQLNVFRSIVTGVDSILRPVGTQLRSLLIVGLKQINTILDNEGRRIINSLSIFIDEFVQNPRKLLVNLLQLRQLSSDVEKTGRAFGTAGVVSLIGFGLSRLTKVAFFANPIIGAISLSFSLLADSLSRVNVPGLQTFAQILGKISLAIGVAGTIFAGFAFFGKLPILFTALGLALKFVAAPLALVFSLFQLISRAVAIAQVGDAQALPGFIARFSEALANLKTAFDFALQPFADFFNVAASIIAPLFSIRTVGDPVIDLMNLLSGALNKFGETVLAITALLNGSLASLAQISVNFDTLGFVGALQNPEQLFAGAQGAFDREFENFLTAALSKKPGDNANAFAQNVVNIGTQNNNINQSFREQQEPDRIAFTIKDQIMKAAQNPLQSRGRSFSGALQGSLSPAGS